MYREVTMIEVREVLRLRGEGLPKKRIAAQLGLDPKTVRRYLEAAVSAGVCVTATISDEEVRQVLLALHPAGGRPRGDGWARCLEQRVAIARWLGDGLRLTKIRKLLLRHGVEIAYPTLHRFAVLELQFGKAATIPVLDGEPGHELQLDTGWVGWLTLPQGKKRRFRAWIFTAVRSRHRFVYPTLEETTARAIEACEAAWEFFGGVFKVLIPDNTKAIIIAADPLAPRITPAFLEYAQARHFHIDPARVRQPRDNAYVERRHWLDPTRVPGPRDCVQRCGASQSGRRVLHLTPYFHRRKMTEISVPLVRQYIVHRQAAKAKNGTINRELAWLKQMFSLAIDAGKLMTRPKIVLLAEDNVRQGFFEQAQFESMPKQLPDDLRPVVTFAYITGWRLKSEVLPLKWRQMYFLFSLQACSISSVSGWNEGIVMSTGEHRRPGRQLSSPAVQLDVRVTDALGTFIPDLTAATDRAGLGRTIVRSSGTICVISRPRSRRNRQGSRRRRSSN
jgi:hypothetical protein